MRVIRSRRRTTCLVLRAVVCSILLFTGAAKAQYAGWQHSGTITILTTPEGADLPASASEQGFPLLVRLNKDFFDFSQAAPHGEDLRFSTGAGVPLSYQIDEWNPKEGAASVWVRIPLIKGNERQELKLFWGNAAATSESSGPAVFNESNGYLSVWHMDDPVKDEVGALQSEDTGTTSSPGIIGGSRHFPGGKGINGGEAIMSYPTGSSPHSTEAWFRADQPNTDIVAWGNEGGGRGSKIRLQLASPPHLRVDSDFADVAGGSIVPLSEWIHVVHTYGAGEGRIYVNGRLDGSSTPTLAIKRPARLWIGGWYNNFSFVGDIDEVRVSKVTRSADWVRMEFENQKPLQTLVGPVMQPGSDFSVSASKLTVPEGQQAAVTARAGGAQKIYWILKVSGPPIVAAVDRLSYTVDAGRVVGDKSLTLELKAVFPHQLKSIDIPVTIREDIPEPVFTLKGRAKWDGRETIEIVPQFSNLKAMQAKGAGALNCAWAASGLAVIKEVQPGKLILKRSQGTGILTVTASVNNGGQPTARTLQIVVKEPAKDARVQRSPDKDEVPVDHQFYARNDRNEGTLYYNGTLDHPADSVFLKVYADDVIYKTERQVLKASKSYTFTVKLKPGLIKYKVEFGSRTGTAETVLHTVTDLVCGDAYLIDGQSNALAVDWGPGELTDTSDWIRSFGSASGDTTKGWGSAVRRGGGAWEIGCWGMDLARRLVESQKIPICIINGAVGGTLIEAHQRNPTYPADPATIYGRLLRRVELARLTYGIREVFWHQGENNQGAQGASGRYGWETYESLLVEISAGWKQDYPNVQRYIIFQIWPNACGMGGAPASDKLRDVQRLLPRLYSNMSIMSTLGIKPAAGCHYPPGGYAEMARLVSPLVERDNYGKAFDKPITPPDIIKAHYTTAAKDEIALEFDQPVLWNDALAGQFYLDGAPALVISGVAAGNRITIKLARPVPAKTIAYLEDRNWDPQNLLSGQNGIAALTFCDVPIAP